MPDTPIPNRTTTQRGFATYDEFVDRSGNSIRVQKSSIATEPCVWIFAEGSGILLTIEQAKRIRDALDVFIAENQEATPDAH